MLKNIKAACGRTNFLTRYKEYWDNILIEIEKEWICSMRDSENNLVIACYFDGKPVFSCNITFFQQLQKLLPYWVGYLHNQKTLESLNRHRNV